MQNIKITVKDDTSIDVNTYVSTFFLDPSI